MFIRYPHAKRSVPLRVFVPNMITTAALCCGLASIHYSLRFDWDHAMFAIALAAIFDALDGRAARLLKASSPFGEMLDSLADFLSFGVAPAMLLHQWMLKSQDIFGMLAVVIFVLCSAMRLARFTAVAKAGRAISEDQRDQLLKAKFFVGLATPAAAAIVLIPPMLVHSKFVGPFVWPILGLTGTSVNPPRLDGPVVGPLNWMVGPAVCIYTVFVGLWMISRVPMFSFKKLRLSRHVVVPMLVSVGLLSVLAVRDIWLMVALLAITYACTVPMSILSRRNILARPAADFNTALPRVETQPAGPR